MTISGERPSSQSRLVVPRGTSAVRPELAFAIAASSDFDTIFVGGGTFGSVLAEHISFRDQSREHRILVLEAGPCAEVIEKVLRR